MLYEKKKLLIHRTILFVLLLVGIIIPIVLGNVPFSDAESDTGDTMTTIVMLIFYVDIVIFVFFIASLLLSYKAYDYNGYEIIVYAGWYHNYIKVNEKKTDEHNTLVSYTAIPLSCTLDDGTDIKVTITMTNRISLKINNQVYTVRK